MRYRLYRPSVWQLRAGLLQDDGGCSVCPQSSSFWLTVMLYVLPAGAVLAAVLLLISKLRLEVTFFTIAVNFFQLLSTFSQFDLIWPDPAHTLFSSVSFINFNIDLLSLESHFPGITYQIKWLACILLPAGVALCMMLFSYGSAVLFAGWRWMNRPTQPTASDMLSQRSPRSLVRRRT